MYQIIFYKDRKGTEPVKDFLFELRNNAGKQPLFEKVLTYIRLLEDKGTWLGNPYVKHLDDGIWELRPTPERILFFMDDGGTFVLLHHFHKKTQKTPPQEIKTAKNRREDYLSRK